MKKLFVTIICFVLMVTIADASTEVSSFDALKTAINSGSNDIKLTSNIIFNDSIEINSSVKINGNNKTITRDRNYIDSFLSITADGSLEIKDVTIDGGAAGWYMDYDNRFYLNGNEGSYVIVPTISSDDDVISSSSLIVNNGNAVLKNVTIQNNRSTVSGSILSGSGSTNINDSTFKHSCSLVSGGALSEKNGSLKIHNSTFKDLVAGCGPTESVQGSTGGAISTAPTGDLEIIDSLFEDNYAQWNAGAVFTYNQNTVIKGTTFTHNMVGNDGFAMQVTSQRTTISVEDSIFEKNIGFSKISQSMGTIINSYSTNTVDNPIVYKNLIFRENEGATGGAMSDFKYSPYVKLENIEAYNNKVSAGGAIYANVANYSINNLNCHDNEAARGGCIYVYHSGESSIDNSIIKDNKASKFGGGIAVIMGKLTTNNLLISNNTSDVDGGGVYVYGAFLGNDPLLYVNNSIIKDNYAKKNGGGISVKDLENINSKVSIDNASKLYDNHSGLAGDDFVYIRTGENNSENGITLNNVANAGINGIDGWYYDNENNRFVDIDKPTKFDDFINYKGSSIYLKAAGINDLEYNLNGGENGKILGVSIRYDTIYTVTDEVPIFDGKSFVGWNTKADGSGSWYYAGDEYDGSDGYVLYAQYSPIKKENDSLINPETRDMIIIVFVLFIISFSLIVLPNITRIKNQM